MRRRHLIAVTVVMALAARAAADPQPTSAPDPCEADAGPVTPPLDKPVHLSTPSLVATDGGSDLHLPPGYYLAEPLYKQWDAETKRLQTAETRLTAENKSLRASASSWQPGWYTLAVTLASGAALGWYAHSKL